MKKFYTITFFEEGTLFTNIDTLVEKTLEEAIEHTKNMINCLNNDNHNITIAILTQIN